MLDANLEPRPALQNKYMYVMVKDTIQYFKCYFQPTCSIVSGAKSAVYKQNEKKMRKQIMALLLCVTGLCHFVIQCISLETEENLKI